MKKKEKEPKAPKVKKIRQRKKISFNNIMFTMISLALTAAVFIGLVTLEQRLTGEIVYVEVVVAKTNIPKGVILNETNQKKYLDTKKIAQFDAVDGVLNDVSKLYGMKTLAPLVKNEPVLLKDCEQLNKKIEAIEHPVQTALETGALSSVAGGIIRTGDLINICITYAGKTTEGTKQISTYILENVYVDAAMDSSGGKIDSENTTQAATLLLLTIEKEDELVLSDALANGRNIRISKVIE